MPMHHARLDPSHSQLTEKYANADKGAGQGEFCGVDGQLYLNVDFIVEFQGDFVDIVCLPLDSLDHDRGGSQIDLCVLQINCVDGQVDNVLLFLLLV
jgi:hypothetical protein